MLDLKMHVFKERFKKIQMLSDKYTSQNWTIILCNYLSLSLTKGIAEPLVFIFVFV